jgi:hypothetical protein
MVLSDTEVIPLPQHPAPMVIQAHTNNKTDFISYTFESCDVIHPHHQVLRPVFFSATSKPSFLRARRVQAFHWFQFIRRHYLQRKTFPLGKILREIIP